MKINICLKNIQPSATSLQNLTLTVDIQIQSQRHTQRNRTPKRPRALSSPSNQKAHL